MKRTWYELLGTIGPVASDGVVNRPCFGLFTDKDVAEEAAGYFMYMGSGQIDIVEVEADWSKAVEAE